MHYQETTWVEPEKPLVIKDGGYVVALVYFPFDSAKLDFEDRRKLELLMKPYADLLKCKDVQFTFTGYADHRGAREYNRGLGTRRALAVKKFFDGMFGDSLNYNADFTFSWGEAFAAQPTGHGAPSRERMAFDRVVAVYASRSPVYSQEIPPEHCGEPSEPVRRIVGREFGKLPDVQEVTDIDTDPTPTKKFSEAVERGAKELLEQTDSLFYGKEKIHLRRFSEFPRHFRVNEIHVKNVFRHDLTVGAAVSQWKTTVSYDWGRASPFVSVVLEEKRKIGEREPRETTRKLFLAREKAEQIRDLMPPHVAPPPAAAP